MIEAELKRVFNSIFSDKLPDKIAVGVSGGVDSMALIFSLKEFIAKDNIELKAVIIDHDFRSNSALEAKKIADILEENNIESVILKSYLEDAPTNNIESILREVRYNLFEEFCLNNGIRYLFIGHHQQDQAENFLIRLFRGSGLDGLSAMDFVSDFNEIKIVRPFLNLAKKQLQTYLENKKVAWFEDETNSDEKYLRNKIRSFISSLDEKDLISQRISLASQNLLDSKKIIDKYLIEKAKDILKFNEKGYYLVNKKEFLNLEPQEARYYLAWILMDISGNYYKPRLKKLQNLYEQIGDISNFNKACLYGCIIKNHDDAELIFYREEAKIVNSKIKPYLIWDNRYEICFAGKCEEVEIVNFNQKDLKDLKLDLLLDKKEKVILNTLPLFKNKKHILAIPHLNFFHDDKIKNDIKIRFSKKSKL